MISKIKNMFSFDLRLLGFFRILVGLALVMDFSLRSFDLTVFYTDVGLYSRDVLLTNAWNPWNWSINMMTGSWEGQLLIFALAIFSAIMILIGYRTKLFLILSYIFLISIQTRNPIITHGGDTVLKLLVFYSIFLPVNARYAIDKISKNSLPIRGTVLSVATVAYILQTIYVYVFSGISKVGEAWLDGSAVYYALNLDMFATPLTPLMLEMPLLMNFFTYSTIYFEKFGFLLLFVPFAWKYFRTVGSLMFMGLHFGFFLFLTLGNFPWVGMILWVIMFPPMVGDLVEKYTEQWGIYQRLSNYRNSARAFINQKLPNLAVIEKPYRKLSLLPSIGLTTVAIGIFVWNLNNVKSGLNTPKFLGDIVRVTATWQEWNMFAPGPMKGDGWFVMDAQIKNGKHIDILNDYDHVDFSKPERASTTYKNDRWHKYMMNMMYSPNKTYLSKWGKYYCNCWNKKYENSPKELESFTIYFVQEMTPPPGQPLPEPNKIDIWSHWCKEEFQNRFANQ